MSLAAILSPSATPYSSAFSPAVSSPTTASATTPIPFNHQSTYISLNRMLIRYQHILLNHPPSDSPTPIQQQIQSELHSPLPYHRTKWLHNIEHARTLLLQLEHAAQSIKVQSAKRAAVHDLAEKRTVIKKLRRYVEDVGREVDGMGEEKWDGGEEGETLEEILGRPPLSQNAKRDQRVSQTGKHRLDEDLKEGVPVTFVEDTDPSISPPTTSNPPPSTTSQRDALFSTARRRRGASPQSRTQKKPQRQASPPLPTPSPPSTPPRANTKSLSSSLLSLAVQLKQQTQAFSATLATSDKDYLSRALDGLDRNVASMTLASKTMSSLKRMSEEQGFLGRLKLYVMIVLLWVLAVGLVFVGPKFRF